MAVAKVERKFDLKPKHIRLIDRVIAQIEAHPENVDMHGWFDTPFDAEKGEWIDVAGATSAKKAFDCGTTCCVAGHTLLAARYPLTEFVRGNEKKGLRFTGPISKVAGQLLGLVDESVTSDNTMDPSIDIAHNVFVVGSWPDNLRERYQRATTKKQEAAAMVARLKYLKKYGA